MKDSKQRLFEVMGRLDKTFKPKEVIQEWNFDKKKDDDSDEVKEGNDSEEKKEDNDSEENKEHEESESSNNEKKELDETKPKIPVNAIAKVGK
jgi:hypothetical protein